MSALNITFSREGRHWRIEVQVGSDVKPRAIFGCREGLEPIISSLETTEAEVAAVGSTSKRNARRDPPLIAVTMPSGRVLTFALTDMQEVLAEAPKAL